MFFTESFFYQKVVYAEPEPVPEAVPVPAPEPKADPTALAR